MCQKKLHSQWELLIHSVTSQAVKLHKQRKTKHVIGQKPHEQNTLPLIPSILYSRRGQLVAMALHIPCVPLMSRLTGYMQPVVASGVRPVRSRLRQNHTSAYVAGPAWHSTSVMELPIKPECTAAYVHLPFCKKKCFYCE